LKDGLEIFTGAFSDIDVDVRSSTMTVGGAVIFRDISDALQAVGKNIRKCTFGV